MERYYLFIVFFCFLLCSVTCSTVNTPKDVNDQIYTVQELNAKDRFDTLLVMLNDTKLNSIAEFSFIFTDGEAIIHVGYTQTYQGYPVVGGSWVGHLYSNNTIEVTDNLKYLGDVDLSIVKGRDSILDISKQSIPRCAIGLPVDRCTISNTSVELVILPSRDTPTQGNLVYKVVYSLRFPKEQWTTFVSARSGVVQASTNDRRSAIGLRATASASLIQNGGLETAIAPWVITGSCVVYMAKGVGAHGGSGFTSFGGSNNAYGSMYQTLLNISSTATAANLTYWTTVSTSETGTSVLDTLAVNVKDAISGASLAVIDTVSNVQAGSGWIQRGPYSLLSLKGKSLRIEFVVTTNANNPTTFKVDDISLQTLFTV